jgi:hypothetical protein
MPGGTDENHENPVWLAIAMVNVKIQHLPKYKSALGLSARLMQ